MPAPGIPAVTSVSFLVGQQWPMHHQLAPQRPDKEDGVHGAQHEERWQAADRLQRLAATAGRQNDWNQNGWRVDDIAEKWPDLSERYRQDRKHQQEGDRSDRGIP